MTLFNLNKSLKLINLLNLSELFFTTLRISLNNDNFQQDSQNWDAQGFVVPPCSDSSQNGEAKKKGQKSRLLERIDKLMQQLKEKEKENRKREKRQRQEHKKEIERQRKESEEKIERQGQKNEGLKKQLNKLMKTLTQSLSASLKQRIKK